MHQTLLIAHSIIRWLVLAALLLSICSAYLGVTKNKPFSRRDNMLRHWTATVAHIQLLIGVFLYIKSADTPYFWRNFSAAIKQTDIAFFGLYHILMMVTSIVLITLGSAFAKRKLADKEKHRTMVLWFGAALLMILLAIPWPFSPIANRPYIRTF
jgi:hypothetical protein